MSTVLLRGGTAAEWTAANPTLAARECGVETDTHRLKVGDGATAWATLPYSSAIADSSITSAMIVDGTIVGGDIASGTVTSANIADGTIVNGDISASASIVGSRLADGAITPIKTSAGYVDKSSAYPLTNDDRVVDVTGTTTITLPTSGTNAGRTFFVRNSGTATVTIATTSSQTIDGASSLTIPGKGFLEVIADGVNWHVLRGQYAGDETLGRRLFSWNHAYSTTGGWQLTYSDTGIRNITADLTFDASVWVTNAPTVYVRRIGDYVTLSGLWRTISPIPGAAVNFFTVPAGYRPATPAGGGNVYGSLGNGSALDSAQGNFYITPSTGVVTLRGLAANNIAVLGITYQTDNAWPAALGGSAVGTIPV